MSKGPQGDTFVVVGFVEAPGPIRIFQKGTFCEMQFRRDARPDLPPLDPVGSPLGVLGSPLGPLGSPLFLLTVAHF